MAIYFDAILHTKKSKIAQTLSPHSLSPTKGLHDPETCIRSPLLEDCIHVLFKGRGLYLKLHEWGKVWSIIREL